ncbi:MAG: MFS transporter permease [Microbacterium sp.]
MWLRRTFFAWLIPAAFVLPAWLLIGWAVFDAGALGFLWVLFLAIPSVLVGQLAFALLVRARGTVRASRAVSWADVAGFALWHALTIALGFFNAASWVALLIFAIVAGLGLFWFLLWELVREARPGRVVLRTTVSGVGYVPPQPPRTAAGTAPEVFVVTERPAPPRA